MPKGKIFTIDYDIYDRYTLVVVGASDKEIAKWVKKNAPSVKIDDEFYEAIACPGQGRTIRDGMFTMLRLKQFDGSAKDMRHLAHEAFHLAEFVMSHIGIVHDWKTSGEAFAYFIGWTVEQVLEGVEK